MIDILIDRFMTYDDIVIFPHPSGYLFRRPVAFQFSDKVSFQPWVIFNSFKRRVRFLSAFTYRPLRMPRMIAVIPFFVSLNLSRY